MIRSDERQGRFDQGAHPAASAEEGRAGSGPGGRRGSRRLRVCAGQMLNRICAGRATCSRSSSSWASSGADAAPPPAQQASMRMAPRPAPRSCTGRADDVRTGVTQQGRDRSDDPGPSGQGGRSGGRCGYRRAAGGTIKLCCAAVSVDLTRCRPPTAQPRGSAGRSRQRRRDRPRSSTSPSRR